MSYCSFDVTVRVPYTKGVRAERELTRAFSISSRDPAFTHEDAVRVAKRRLLNAATYEVRKAW